MTRTRRRALTWTTAVVGALTLFALAGLPVYVFPATAEPRRADVVQVLGPALDERVDEARMLLDEGLVDGMLVSVPLPGEPASDLGVCDEPDVVCATPDPYTTDGETVLLEEYARDHGAETAIVLTGTGHVSRARFVYAKCYPGEVTVVAVPTPTTVIDWVGIYVYQTAAFVKALVTPCAHAEGDR